MTTTILTTTPGDAMKATTSNQTPLSLRKPSTADATLSLRKSAVRCWVHASPNSDLEGRKPQLVNFLVRNFPEVSRGGHRGLVNRMDVFASCEHECPKCHIVHKGLAQIAKNCGLRFISNRGTGGKYYFQSWCHECRSTGGTKSKEDPTFGVRINSANADCTVFTN